MTPGAANQSVDIPVYVVVPPRVLLLDIAGPIEVLRKANLEQSAIQFTVNYVGPSRTAGSSIGLAVTGIGPLPDRLPERAIVLISGNADAPLGVPVSDRDDDAVRETAIVDWLKRSIRPGIRLVSICSGALLAARAGLLDGYDCTTHHATTAQLSCLAPAARVHENRLYVDDGERLTSAGITAGIDLMLYIGRRWRGMPVRLRLRDISLCTCGGAGATRKCPLGSRAAIISIRWCIGRKTSSRLNPCVTGR